MAHENTDIAMYKIKEEFTGQRTNNEITDSITNITQPSRL